VHPLIFFNTFAKGMKLLPMEIQLMESWYIQLAMSDGVLHTQRQTSFFSFSFLLLEELQIQMLLPIILIFHFLSTKGKKSKKVNFPTFLLVKKKNVCV